MGPHGFQQPDGFTRLLSVAESFEGHISLILRHSFPTSASLKLRMPLKITVHLAADGIFVLMRYGK